MQQFVSHGPVEKNHFRVERRALVEQCVDWLVGSPGASGGHYFTIWGPRQTGKTWIMHQVVEEIRMRYADNFVVGTISMRNAIIDNQEPPEALFKYLPRLFHDAFGVHIETPIHWGDVSKIFSRFNPIWGAKRLILLIDDFDTLRPEIIDRLTSLFRTMCHERERYVLHGLALDGVRSVLAVDRRRGPPFNIQRLMKIPNLVFDEVAEMFAQYQQKTGQLVEPSVVEALYEATRGRPGLVGWFAQLLAEKYNAGSDKPITMADWERIYEHALRAEGSDTDLNACGPYQAQVVRLFADSDVRFAMEEDWCSYLYMNGLVDEVFIAHPENPRSEKAVCRFSCPFVQKRLYSSFTTAMFGDKGPQLPLEITDLLSDVFTLEGINTPKLLERYRAYLKRLKAKGIDPWIGQPRRQDLHYTEAVGHFHLYAWLLDAVGRRCSVSPEFPTGNGKVDLVLRKKDHTAVIEVKSLSTMAQLGAHRSQAAGYARKLGLNRATLVVFAPVDDESVLDQLAGVHDEDGVVVTTVPFGWV